ncbi:MAG TPA: acetyl-CoA carboxylase biotin carboxyl carrier protein [bacterium]|nr:acetyl-CoA carboxylase biotin carboxyl carrier protein [bacterium]
MMKIAKIRKLIELLENHDIGHIELSNWFTKVKISKNSGTIMAEGSGTPGNKKIVKEATQTASQAVESSEAASKTEETSDNRVEIKSPIVGTFYRAPAPDADSFVQAGDSFNTGDTLCIVEAMKVMNEIEAEFSGKIVKILVENAEPVEYEQPLFLVDKQ